MTRKLAGAMIISVLLFMAGCKQDMDNTKLSPYLYDYVPVDVGHSVTYDVDSIWYTYDGSTQVYDTLHYQLKEVILDSGNSVCQYQPGVMCYGMAEYKRYDTTQPFPSYYQAWYFYTNMSSYVTVQQDLTFVRFTFPPITGSTWMGNEYLPANDTIFDTYQTYSLPSPWVYTFTSVNSPNTVNGHHLDSTSVVTQVNSQNAVNSTVCIETYARHIGLVYRQWEVINKQDVTSSWAAPNQANGFRILQWYHSYTP
jgi:hypothetical protein